MIRKLFTAIIAILFSSCYTYKIYPKEFRASSSLMRFGLSFDNLNILQEYGLVISDYNSYMPYAQSIVTENNTISFPLSFEGKLYCLVPIDIEKYDKIANFHEVALTKSGRELLDIIPVKINEEYTGALKAHFESKYLRFPEL
ncbi:MAG: hypothetical protein ABI091_01940 [Ferruginibacter sp.]